MAKRSGNKIPKILVRKGRVSPQKVCLTYRPGKSEGSLEGGLIAIATLKEGGVIGKDEASALFKRLRDYRGGAC